MRIDPGVDRIVDELYSGILGTFWPPERKLIDDHFVSVYFPFNEIDSPAFQMEAFWDLDHLIGYLGTWSAVNRYKDVSDTDPLGLVYPELSRAWGGCLRPEKGRLADSHEDRAEIKIISG